MLVVVDGALLLPRKLPDLIAYAEGNTGLQLRVEILAVAFNLLVQVLGRENEALSLLSHSDGPATGRRTIRYKGAKVSTAVEMVVVE